MTQGTFCLYMAAQIGVSAPVPTANREADVIRGIEHAQLAREERMTGYSVTEKYVVKNSRFGEAAEMTVEVTYAKGAGKVYRVISRRGPSFLQTRLLDRVLKEETELSRGDTRKAALVTGDNYRMKWVGEELLGGRNCEVVLLEPRKKSPHLLRGKAWVDAVTRNMVRIEGRPAASLSFWANSPLVTRDYFDIGDFSFARKSLAVSQSFLLGRTELTVEYTDYQINNPGTK